MTISWITPRLGTGPFGVDDLPTGSVCIDIRALVDRGGNSPAVLVEHVLKALSALDQGHSVLICCDHGISRSNALAAAVLSQYEKIPVSEAVHRVLIATHNAEIRLEVLDSIRVAFEDVRVSPVRLERQRWLLTGGHGYLGSALSASAPKNIDLICPSRVELDLYEGGPAIDLLVRENQVSRILHFAAPHVGNVNSSFGGALVALRNVLDACVSNNLPLVLPSRWEVFSGYKGMDTVADETTPLKPFGVFGDTKFLSEKLVETFVERAGIRALILRSALVYGGASAPNFMRSFIKRALAGESISTHTYSNGEPKLDILHLDDWVSGCWALLQSDLDGIYHCGSGSLVSTSEVAKLIMDSVDGVGDISRIEILDDVANVALDSHKLEKAAGWTPRIDPCSGIPAFVKACYRA